VGDPVRSSNDILVDVDEVGSGNGRPGSGDGDSVVGESRLFSGFDDDGHEIVPS